MSYSPMQKCINVENENHFTLKHLVNAMTPALLVEYIGAIDRGMSP